MKKKGIWNICGVLMAFLDYVKTSWKEGKNDKSTWHIDSRSASLSIREKKWG